MKAHYREILRLGLPIFIGQLGMIFVGFADNIMVGRYSTEALASASFVNNLFNVIVFLIMGFTYGITPLVGALFAQKGYERIGALMRNALLLNVVYTFIITAVMIYLYTNLHLLGQPEELLPLIRPYYLLYLAGLLPIALFNVFAQWSYGIRNTRLPMWIVLGTNLLNVVGNYALIYGNFGLPELGLFGAGISTLVARVVGPIILIFIFFRSRKYSEYRRGFAAPRLRRDSLGTLWRTSLPVSLQLGFESGSFTVAAIMSGWLGTVPLAAFQIIVIVGTLGFCLYYAVGSAVSVLVANCHGAGDTPGERRVAWAGYHIMLVLAACSSTVFVVLGPQLMGMFTSDAAVFAAALALLFPLVLYQLGDATQITFANALRGTSHVMPMLWIAFVSYVVVGIPATYLLGFTAGLGLYGIILSFSASLFLAGALFLTFFLRATRLKVGH